MRACPEKEKEIKEMKQKGSEKERIRGRTKKKISFFFGEKNNNNNK